MDKMNKIRAAKLPGFYTDERGAYGVIIGDVYICCSVNDEDGKYDVTIDGIDHNGDFAENQKWESFDNPEDAIACLRRFVKRQKHYTPATIYSSS